jgi:hypothetical protein
MKRTVVAISVMFFTIILFLACAPEKKPDFTSEINAKGKIVAEADAMLAANKFDEAAATYQRTLSELSTLKQKVPAGDPALAALDTLVNTTKGKLDNIPAAKQQYEAKIAAETKKPEVAPEVKPEAKPEVKPEAKLEVKPKAKPKTKVEPVTKAAPKAKPEIKEEAKPEAKSENQTKAEPVVEPQKKEPIKWKVVANSKLPTGEAEWHILCNESFARIVRQDPKKEKPYMAGYGGQWYKSLQEAAAASCAQ